MHRPTPDFAANLLRVLVRPPNTNLRLGSPGRVRRLARVASALLAALFSAQCLGDIINPPSSEYDVEGVAPPADTLNVGDSVAAPAVRLLVNGKVAATVTWTASVLTGTDVMRVDTASGKLIVMKPGVSTVRVKPVSSAITDTTLGVNFTLTAVVGFVTFSGSDTAYSISDTLKPAASPAMRSGSAVPGPTLKWSVVGADTAAVLLDENTGWMRAVKNGEIRLRAKTDTAGPTHTYYVRQRPAKLTVSPSGVTFTGSTTTFTVAATDAKGNAIASPGSISWSSMRPSVATINSTSGVATAISSGQTTITATVPTATGYALATVATAPVAAVNVWAPATSGVTTSLNAVWAHDPSTVYAVGDGGIVRSWNGSAWNPVTTSGAGTNNLYAVWGSSASNVYVAGASSTVRQFNGTLWNPVTVQSGLTYSAMWGASPSDAFLGGSGVLLMNPSGSFLSSLAYTGSALATWGTSASNVYVSTSGNPGMARFTGSTWSTAGMPAAPGVFGIWGTSASNIFAVGSGSVVQRYDGTAWTAATAPGPTVTLRGVWGTGTTDVYAVGVGGKIVRFDGTSWSAMSSGVSTDLNGIVGTGSEVFVVGASGVILRGYRGGTVSVSPATPTITTAGGTQQLTPTAKDAAGATLSTVLASTYTWTSSDTLVAKVNSSGLVTAVNNGTASVCGAAPGGASGCASVTVDQPAGPVRTITISPSGASTTTGTKTFTAVARDSAGIIVTGKTFSWSSLNTSVATANTSTGVYTPVSSGQAAVAASVDGITGYALLTVATPNVSPVNLWVSENSGVTSHLNSVWGVPGNLFAVGEGGVVRRNTGSGWVASSTSTSEAFNGGIWGSAGNDVFAGVSGATSSRIFRFNGSGWSTSLSSGAGGGITGVWGVSPKEVYATESGSVHKYDGVGWSATQVGSSDQLLEIWGSGKDTIWVVGRNGRVMRFNGSAWVTMTTGVAAFDALAIWGSGPNDVYIAGGKSAIRWSGSAFSSIATGLPSDADITGLWGTSGTDLYASSFGGKTFRYNGTSWSVSDSAGGGRGIWGVGNGDVVVVGSEGTIRRGRRNATVTVSPSSTLLSTVGATRTLTPTAKDAAGNGVSGVSYTWSSSSTGVVTVSAAGVVTAVAQGTATVCATAPGGAQGCATVYVGDPISSITVSPNGVTIGSGTTTLTATPKDSVGNPLTGVSLNWTSHNTSVATVNATTGVVTAVSSGQATISASARGTAGYALVTVAMSGATPANLLTSSSSGVSSNLNGVWGISATSVYAVGDGGVIRRFNGTSWSVEPNVPTSTKLNAIWGSSPSDIFAVGNPGTIIHFDGSSWATMTNPATQGISSVWGTSPSDVFAVGPAGRIMRYDGSTWSAMTSNTSQTLNAVYGFSPTSVFAAGFGGTVMRYNGTTWAAVNSGLPGSEEIGALWGTSASDLFAVSQSTGAVYHFDGTAWVLQSALAPDPLNGVWGSSASDVYAVGNFGRMSRFGASWTATTTGTNVTLIKVWGTSSGDVWAVGSSGTILRGVRGASIELSPATLTLTAPGAAQQLTATVKDAANATVSGVTLTWTSSNSGAAAVSGTGLVSPVANGTTTVCVTAPGGLQSCVPVTVGVTVASVSVTPPGVSISSGSSGLTAIAKDGNGNAIGNTAPFWTSLNPSVATVAASTGVVSPVASGQAAIAASVGGVTGYAVVTVATPNAVPVNLWAATPSGTGQNLWDVWAFDATNVFAVGENGVVVRYNGTSWARIDSGSALNLFAVSGVTPNGVHVGGGNIRSFDGTNWTAAQGTFGGVYDLWSLTPRAGFAAASDVNGGQLVTFDGSTWQKSSTIAASGQTGNRGAWASATNHAIAGMGGGTVAVWNGTNIGTVELPGIVNAIWGASASDIYATLHGGGVQRSITGGNSWSAMSAPPSPCCYGIWGTSNSEIYTTGLASGTGYVLRYNGSAWDRVNTGVGVSLYGIGGTFSGDVWAVGNQGKIVRGVRGGTVAVAPASPTLAAIGATEQLTPTAKDASNNTVTGVALYTWSSSDPAKATVNSSGLLTAVANGTTNVCATAPGGAQGCTTVTVAQAAASIIVSPAAITATVGGGGSNVPVAQAKDANDNVIGNPPLTWSSLNPSVATVNPTTGAVTGVGSGQATLVATSGSAVGYSVITVTAQAVTPVNLWARMTTPVTVQLQDVWGTSASNVYVVGNGGTMLRFNGTSWSTVDVGAAPDLYRICGTSANDLFVVGNANGNNLLHYNGATWTSTQSVTSGGVWAVNGVWCGAPNSVVAVDGHGSIFRFNGSGWTAASTGSTADLFHVWGASAGTEFAVGADGRILRANGPNWSPMTSPTSQHLSYLWGGGPDKAYAVGQNGTVLKWDGSNWTTMTSGTSVYLRGVWGSSENDVYAVGQGGTILRLASGTWTAMTSGTSQQLFGVWGTSSGDVFAVGDGGTVLRGVRGATVALTPTNPTLTTLGATQQLSSTPKDATNTAVSGLVSYTWTSSDPAVATVSSSGLVTAVADGTTNVCATAAGGVQGCATVTVNQAASVTTVTLAPAAPTLSSIGAIQQLTPTAKDANNSVIGGLTFAWTSSNTGVATVSASSGLVTAVANGTASVCAAVSGGVQGCTSVTVGQVPATISVTPGTSMGAGTTTLSAAPKDSNGNVINGSVLWSSLNPGVATVNASTGDVTAVTSGQVAIAATYGGVTGYGLVTVTIPVATPVNLWVPQASNNTTVLLGAWAASANDIFVAAGAGAILRYNGTSWSAMSTPVSASMRGVWGTSATDVFAVGNAGTIIHYNGSTWSTMSSGTSANLTAVWGSSPTDVFAVGTSGTILHYNGSAWSAMVSSTTETLRAVWGLSQSDVHVFGQNGVIRRYNGSVWQTMPNGPAGDPNGGLWGRTSADVYAVYDNGIVLHFDGTNWSQVATGTAEHITGIWGSATSDLYATGTNGTILRFDGSTWTTMPSGTNELLWRVTGHGTNVVAVGNNGTILRGLRGGTVTVTPATPTLASLGATQQLTATVRDATTAVVSGLAVTWSSSSPSIATVSASGLVTAVANGSTAVCATASGGAQGCTSVTVGQAAASVSVSPSGAALAGGTTTFTATPKDANGNAINGSALWSSLNPSVATVNASTGVVTAVSSGQATIVATAGTVTGYGLVTVSMPSAPPVNLWVTTTSPTTALLNGIWAARSDRAFAVSSTGGSGRTLHYDGSQWSTGAATSTDNFNAVWGLSETDVYAVGANASVDRYDGSAWSHTTSTTGVAHLGVWGSSPTDVHVVGTAGSAQRYNGSSWTTLTSTTSQNLAGIWGSARDNVFAVGTSGTIVAYDGTAWGPVSSGTAQHLQAVWGTSATNAYAVGFGGTILKYDGQWAAMTSPTSADLFGVWGSSPTEVYAVGTGGTILRYNGTAWSQLTLGNAYRAVWGTSSGDVFAVGFQGGIARGVRGAVVTVTPSNPTITVLGGTQQMAAAAQTSGGQAISGATFTWSSSDNAIATVSASGLVTAVSGGTATITATALGGAAGSVTFTVVGPNSPALPAGMAQFFGNGTTPLILGQPSGQTTVVFTGSTTDPNAGDQIRLEVEAMPVGTPFANARTGSASPTFATGQTGTVTLLNLARNTSYHWQVRACDQGDLCSAWTSFGGNAESEPDFAISQSEADAEAPTVTAVSVNRNTVDVRTAADSVEFTITTTDDLVGVYYQYLYFVSPNGNQNRNCYFYQPTSGTVFNGTYKCRMVWPRFAEAGTWTWNYISAVDSLQNTRYYYAAEAAANGWASTITVQSTSDNAAPVITAVSVNKTSVDVRSAGDSVDFTLTATDDLVGINYFGMSFRSPGGGQSRQCYPSSPATGTVFSGTYTCRMYWPRFAEAGVWTWNYIYAVDSLQNTRYYYTAEAESNSWPSTITVQSTSDAAAPIISAVSVNRTTVDVRTASDSVDFTLTGSDDLAGINYFGMSFQSPSGGQSRQCYPSTPTTGTVFNGTYTCRMSWPRFAEAGTWRWNFVYVVDSLYNQRYYDLSTAKANGWPTEIVSLSSTPSISSASLAQFRSDGSTSILRGSATNQSTVVLKGSGIDADVGDQLQFQVEVQPVGTGFTNSATSNVAVSSGQTASLSVAGLVDGTSFHWQARICDQTAACSPWTSFGDNGESQADFTTNFGAPASVTVTPSPVTLTSLGAQSQQSAEARDASNNVLSVTFTWSSNNTNVVTVNSSGLVTAVANGTTNVCATAQGGTQACVTVTVAQVAASITVSPSGATISAGATAFSAAVRDANNNLISGTSIAWSSLNPSVATVNANTGIVTAVASGQTTISATAGSVTGYALVTVAIGGATSVGLWVPMSSGVSAQLQNVFGLSSTSIFVPTTGGTVLSLSGGSWSPVNTGAGFDLNQVWGTSPTNLWAMGTLGRVVRYNGTSWTAMQTSTSEQLQGLWGSAPNNVYVTGDQGAVSRFDGSTWSTVSTGLSGFKTGMWGAAADNVFMLGPGYGTVARFNGTTWTSTTIDGNVNLTGIWGRSSNDVWAVGYDRPGGPSAIGRIYHFDGSSWSLHTSTLSGRALNRVWGIAADEVYAVGDAGTVMRYNGSSWTSVSSGTTQTLSGVWGTSNSDVFVVGAAGTILRGVRGATASVTPVSPSLSAPGNTVQLSAAAKDASNNTVTGVTFTWSSATPSVATVDGTGLVTAVASGTSVVCATAPAGAQGCATVSVGVTASVAAGMEHTCALTTAGAAYCWGSNDYGQLGTGDGVDATSPTAVSSAPALLSITGRSIHSCGLTAGGAAYCWGYNYEGQVGDGTNSYRYSPVAVSGGVTFTKLSASRLHTCGLTPAGAVYCWGYNSNGQLGDGTTTQRLVPTAVSGAVVFKDIAAGDNQACGLSTGGTPYCWGSTLSGSLLTPTAIATGLSFQSIKAGAEHVCALTSSGSAYCWGFNEAGQLGDGTTVGRSTPTAVAGGHSFRTIATGDRHTCAVTLAGAAYCWGENAGQLGDATVTDRLTPVAVAGGLAFNDLSAGQAHTCGRLVSGGIYCWGFNGKGQLGDGNGGDQLAPVAVSGSPSLQSIAVGILTSCGLVSGGSAYCWGYNQQGQVGDGTYRNRATAVPVSGGLTFQSLSVGYVRTCALTTSGSAYCWGSGYTRTPTAVSGGFTFLSISAGESHACGLLSGGTVRCWGENWAGQLGDGTTDYRSAPTAVSGGVTFASISTGGYHTCALTAAGVAYCWGYNSNGALGTVATTNLSTPTPVQGGLTFQSISAGYYYTCGLTSAGAVYCWGAGNSSPVAISGAPVLQSVSAGYFGACGLTSTGSAYCWGNNEHGHLGDGTTDHRSTPGLVLGGLTFQSLQAKYMHTCGLTTGGAAYCWGDGSFGQTGHGAQRLTPTPVTGGLPF